MFLFKKLVSPLLFPLPVSVLLLLAGVLLLWSGRRKRAGVLAVTLGTGLLLLFSSPFFPGWALRRLEQQYPYYTPAAAAGREVKWVVVLSGGSSDDPSLPLTGRLSPESIARLVEGIRIARQHPEARLFLTGGVPESIRPESHLLRELSIDLGFPRERIVIEGKTRDTEEQAVAIRQVVGRDAFVLVTSASHMARSVALCRRQGLEPIPAPTAHRIRRAMRREPLTLRKLYPSVYYLDAATTLVYERLGLLWARLRSNA